jgi:hypothetical protein
VNIPKFGRCRHHKEITIVELREIEMLMEVPAFKPSLMEEEYNIESLVTDVTGHKWLVLTFTCKIKDTIFDYRKLTCK